MAASSGRGYHQDYIARIRYSNALPPPPNPPKLLEIPNTGLSSGQYTSAGFASRLAREQPLNIEADAELGMPIDLVGIPGVFEGDESAIFPSPNPVIDEADRRLLRPLASLGKNSTSTSAVSFLRRTEYMTSSAGSQPRSSGGSAFLSKSPGSRPRKRRIDENKEEPLQIAKGIVKGFDLAYPSDAYTGPDEGTNIRGAEITSAEKDAWRRPKHPTKGDAVKLLDSYPVLPDWDALPPGLPEDQLPPSFITFKFTTNPVGIKDIYDESVDVALLRQHAVSEEETEKYNQANEAWAKDPENNSRYAPLADYVLFLPDESVEPIAVKRKFDALFEDQEDELYGVTDDMEPRNAFRYNNVRVYETYRQATHIDDTFEEIAITLHDPQDGHSADDRGGRKAAYFYPIMQRSMMRQKGKKFDMVRGTAVEADELNEAERIDALDVRVRDFNVDESEAIAQEKAAFEASEA